MVAEESNTKWFHNILSKNNKFRLKTRVSIFSDLKMLLSSGIDIANALSIASENLPKNKDRQQVEQINLWVKNGKSLSQAFDKSRRFSAFEIHCTKIGEETGRLGEVFESLATYCKTSSEQKRKISSALAYPIFVLFTAMLVVVFMLSFVVPLFEDVFTRYDQELPAVTKWVLSLSDSIGQNLFLTIAVILIISFVLNYFKKKNARIKHLLSKIQRRVPFYGDISWRIQINKFCQAMHLLTSTKTPLVTSLSMVDQMIKYYPINYAILSCQQDIINGASLHQALSKHWAFEKRFISIIKVGEQTNQLDLSFQRLNDLYQADIKHKTDVLGNMLEPILIFFVGLVVGFILVSMYLPIFQISTSLSN